MSLGCKPRNINGLLTISNGFYHRHFVIETSTAELDAFLECSIEQPPEVCEDEYMSRQDLSEALLQQGEALEYEMYMRQQGAMMPPDEGAMPPMYGDAMEGGASPYGASGGATGGNANGASSYVVEDNAVNKPDATPRASVYRADEKPFNWDALAP